MSLDRGLVSVGFKLAGRTELDDRGGAEAG
jgi:hypothetical protein